MTIKNDKYVPSKLTQFLQKAGTFASRDADSVSLKELGGFILEAIVTPLCLLLIGPVWCVLTFRAEMLFRKFSKNPSRELWDKALKIESLGRFTSSLFVNSIRGNNMNSLGRLYHKVLKSSDSELASNLPMPERLTDSDKILFLQDAILRGSPAWSFTDMVNIALFLHEHREAFARVLHRDSEFYRDNYSSVLAYQNLVHICSSVRDYYDRNMSEELYNALSGPMLMHPRVGYEKMISYRGDLDTLDGFIYNSINAGFNFFNIIEARKEDFIADMIADDANNALLPEEWLVKLIEASIPERYKEYRELNSRNETRLDYLRPSDADGYRMLKSKEGRFVRLIASSESLI